MKEDYLIIIMIFIYTNNEKMMIDIVKPNS